MTAKKALEHLLRPCGDTGVGECLTPMLFTQAIENLDNLPEKITPDQWLSATVDEYARHLRDYPIDILRAACDAHVRGGSQFFPKVFEITKHATPAFEKRKREAWRVDKLIESTARPVKAAASAFVPEPRHVILLTTLKWQELTGSRLFNLTKAAATRRELAALAEQERVDAVMAGRAVADWATFDYLAGIVEAMASAPASESPPPVHPSVRSTAVSVGDAAEEVVRKAAPDPWTAGQPLYQQRKEEPPMSLQVKK